MCFYDYYVFRCGDWKFGNFRDHCQREYRMGETCGMKMFQERHEKKEKCSICTKIDTKKRKYEDRKQKVKRWEAEGDKPASVAKALEEMTQLALDIKKWTDERNRLLNAVGTRG